MQAASRTAKGKLCDGNVVAIGTWEVIGGVISADEVV
jgi:hypothetical protein